MKKVHNNGVLDIDFGSYTEPIHIRRLHPFYDNIITKNVTNNISRGGEYHTYVDAEELKEDLE